MFDALQSVSGLRSVSSAGICERLEQPLLHGCAPGHIFRAPLHGKTERIIFQLQRFCKSLRTVCRDSEAFSHFVNGLMMQTVDGERIRIQKIRQKAVGIQVNGMRGACPVPEVRVLVFLL